MKLIIEKAQMPCCVAICGFYSFHPMGELLKSVIPLWYKRLNRFRQMSFTDSGGILSKLSGILADNGIGIFAVSTYNTDYILVKAEDFEKALTVLSAKGYTVC